jgi:hypothetical protein
VDVQIIGECTYTEWLAFDDGEDFLDVPYPVPLPDRNLTFGPGDPITSWGPHAHPAFGAPGFLNAPIGYAPLRIVTGGGVPNLDPLLDGALNYRNQGRIWQKQNYPIRPGVTAVTLVAKMACGNRELYKEMIQLNGMGHRFALGVDGMLGSSKIGRFARGTTDSFDEDIFKGRTVQVALARRNVWGPHFGEFFTFRLILRNNGTVEAWLNDDPDTWWTKTTGIGIENSVQLSPDHQAGTMWVDYVRVFEGELPLCGNPVFDVNRDGQVNSMDWWNGTNGFLDCATGQAAPPALFDAL